eukprot:7020958-Pyramimonas_sp.AAC.1
MFTRGVGSLERDPRSEQGPPCRCMNRGRPPDETRQTDCAALGRERLENGPPSIVSVTTARFPDESARR